MKKSSLKTTCFSTSIFLRFWLHFGCFGKALGPLLGGFGRLKWRPRGWGTLNQAYFCFNFFHFRGCTFNFLRFGRVWGRFGEGSGKVWDGFGEVWGRILDRFEDLGLGFSATRVLCFDKYVPTLPSVMARRNARSDPPPHRRWRRVLDFKSNSWPISMKPNRLSSKVQA